MGMRRHESRAAGQVKRARQANVNPFERSSCACAQTRIRLDAEFPFIPIVGRLRREANHPSDARLLLRHAEIAGSERFSDSNRRHAPSSRRASEIDSFESVAGTEARSVREATFFNGTHSSIHVADNDCDAHRRRC